MACLVNRGDSVRFSPEPGCLNQLFHVYGNVRSTCMDRFTQVTLTPLKRFEVNGRFYSFEVNRRGTFRNGELSNSLHRHSKFSKSAFLQMTINFEL